jgi:hypothetical protein
VATAPVFDEAAFEAAGAAPAATPPPAFDESAFEAAGRAPAPAAQPVTSQPLPVPSRSPAGGPPVLPRPGAKDVTRPAVTPPIGGQPASVSPPPVERLGPATRSEIGFPMPPNVAPFKYPKSAAELEYAQIREDRKRVPAYLQAPGRPRGEYGPVATLETREKAALARWYHQERPEAIRAFNDEYRKLEADKKQLEALRAAGEDIPKPMLVSFQQRRLGLEERAREFEGLEARFSEFVSETIPLRNRPPIHGGTRYPEEGDRPGVLRETMNLAADQPLARPFRGVGKFFGIETMGQLGESVIGAGNFFQAGREAQQALARLQWEGRGGPPLPEIPYKDRGRGIREKNAMLDAVNVLGARLSPDGKVTLPGGAMSTPELRRAAAAVTNATPFQRKLIPILQQQRAAEREAVEIAGMAKAGLIDLATLGAAEGIASAVRGLIANPAVRERVKQIAPRVFARYAAATAPTLAAEFSPLSRAALNRLVLREAPKVGVSILSGGTAGGITSGGATAAMGGTPEQIRESAAKGALGGATLAGGLTALLGGAEGTLRSGWDAERSPQLIAALVADARRQGVPADRLGRLEQLLTRAAKAPTATKVRVFSQIRREFGPAVGRAAPTKAGAARPKAGPGEYIAPEKPKGPTVTTATGQELALRETPRDVLAQVAGSGDPAAEAAQAWVDRHEAYEVQRQASVPPDVAVERSYGTEWTQSPVSKQHAVLAAAAQNTPEIADLLNEAAEELRQDWHWDWARRANPEGAVEPVVGPPIVSVWRRLTPEQRAALPAGVRNALLVQDINNSMRTIAPARGPIFDLSEFDVKTQRAAERFADEAFENARRGADAKSPGTCNNERRYCRTGAGSACRHAAR